ncbi:MAG: hypothetical protein NT049_15235 [Planctomycetota bacterium]|nr:hypothetical protein [Planctomycetota bacterium]
MEPRKPCTLTGCPELRMGRRTFLGAASASALVAALQMAGCGETATRPVPAPGRMSGPGPKVRAVFIRPKAEKYWMGWPGASYDLAAHQNLYIDTLQNAADDLGVDLAFAEPLYDAAGVTAFLDKLKADPPQGILVTLMDIHRWPDVDRIVAERGTVPMVVFAPMGVTFTGHLQKASRAPGVFVGSTQDVDWLSAGLRMHRTIWDMKHSRIAIAAGTKTEDKVLEPTGTTLHYVPRERFVEELAKVQECAEARAVADYYTRVAKKIVEPSREDILNAAENYVACKNLMAVEKCQGISMDCLGLVSSRKIPCPPCIGFSRLLDEGFVGACEADVNATISHLLVLRLCERPGFQQDPVPNTVNNTFMGAHCTCATRLDGFNKPHEPIILRSHSESAIGVSPQVLWRLGQKVTVMQFQGGGQSMLLGTGKVVSNIDTPPSGGCRTSVELAMDDIPDSRDVKGFHQLFLYGDHSVILKGYCQLAGIQAVHI